MRKKRYKRPEDDFIRLFERSMIFLFIAAIIIVMLGANRCERKKSEQKIGNTAILK